MVLEWVCVFYFNFFFIGERELLVCFIGVVLLFWFSIELFFVDFVVSFVFV